MTGPQIGLIIAAYFLGSIPTGYWLGKLWKGIDIRQVGSGNVGATNVFRVLGKGPGIFTLLVDVLKGLTPVLIAKHLFPSNLLVATLTGLAAILGHTLSVFVRFQGGKGMATSAGVFAALMTVPALIGIFVFVSVSGVTRYVSLGSILGAITLVVCAFIFPTPPALAWTAVGVAVFVVWKHKKNIQRLLNGTELRLEWSKKTP